MIIFIKISIWKKGESMEEINIYCDESCHLENDGSNIMILGAVWCPKNKVKQISKRIAEIKSRNEFETYEEIKWTKVSPCNLQLYKDIINFFFDSPDLHARIYIANKEILDHQRYNQTHDDWYYKIYFRMLEILFDRAHRFNIYVDIKDTNSHKKCQKLWEVCSNSQYDFNHDYISKIQPIRSHESQIIQIADILIGAIGHLNRNIDSTNSSSQSKIALINLIKERSGFSLTKNTPHSEKKLNIYRWGWW